MKTIENKIMGLGLVLLVGLVTLGAALDRRSSVPPSYSTLGRAFVADATEAAMRTRVGIQSGSLILTSNGTITNTFASAFSVAPVVVASGTETANAIWTSAVGTTSVIFHGITNSVVKWVAIGTP